MILTLYGFMISLKHSMPLYVIINNGELSMYVHYTLHAVGLLGLIGHFIKLYKPDEDAKYFEYGSLGLFMVGVVIYLTNLRTGVNSCLVGQWGDVDYQTGINVMAASQVMIILFFWVCYYYKVDCIMLNGTITN